MKFRERLVRGVGYLVTSSEQGLKFVEETGGGHCFVGATCEDAIIKYRERRGDAYSLTAILHFMTSAPGQHYVTTGEGVVIQSLEQPSPLAVVQLVIWYRDIIYRVQFADGSSFSLPMSVDDIPGLNQDEGAVE